MEGDGIEHAPTGALRDLWEITWGYTFAFAPRNTFWYDVGRRLHDTGWVWYAEQGGIGRFKLLQACGAVTDPRDIPLQVLTDLWLVRWGNEKVPARVLQEAHGDWHRVAQRLKIEGIVDRIPVHNDWPYVARLLKANGKLLWHDPVFAPGIFYQLKETPPSGANKE